MRAVYEKVPADDTRFFVVKQRRDPRFEFRWHHHREYELTLIGRSHGQRFVGDHIEDYGEGDLVLLGPDLPHTWCSAATRGRHDAVVVQFGDDLIGAGRLDGRLGPTRVLLDRARLGVRFGRRARTRIAPRLRQLTTLTALRQLAELLLILDDLAADRDAATLSTRVFVPQLHPGAPHPIDEVCRHLQQHHAERIPLSAAARMMSMSPSAFSRYFRRTTGKTFVGYLAELRVAHACRLLRETDRSIADIAGAAGFANLSHFGRLFRRLRKMQPRAYRRASRGAGGARTDH